MKQEAGSGISQSLQMRSRSKLEGVRIYIIAQSLGRTWTILNMKKRVGLLGTGEEKSG